MTGLYDQLKADLDYLQWPRAAECFDSAAHDGIQVAQVGHFAAGELARQHLPAVHQTWISKGDQP